MVHFILRMAAFDAAFMAVYKWHNLHFNGWFEYIVGAFIVCWLVDPALKKASHTVYSGWMYLWNRIAK